MDSNNQKGMLSEELDTTKMPGHWLLARLGKRVLRPGGRELTRQRKNLAAIMLVGIKRNSENNLSD